MLPEIQPDPPFRPQLDGSANGTLPALEREAMAWPPARWERDASAWREDTWLGPEPFMPYVADGSVALPLPRVLPGTRHGWERTFLREAVETLLLTAFIFLGIRFVVQNYKIEGSSMEPNLHSGEYLLVNKLAYQVSGKPERGDIVVFHEWNNGDKDFIKRVIAVPGEQVEIRPPNVYINGNRLEEPYLDQPTNGAYGPITLATDEFWVMGDNRGNSSDSRANGPLPKPQIVGKAWVTYWPPGQIGVVQDRFQSYASRP